MDQQAEIKILDCSLRDGAHVNSGRFGEKTIKAIIKSLVNAKVDIVEIGFLKDCVYDSNVTDFNCVSQAYRFLPDAGEKCEYAMMVRSDWFNIKNLQRCSGRIKHLRFAFHQGDFNAALYQAQYAKELGYMVYLNPVNTPGYSDAELNELLSQVEKIEPHGIYVVDTFGSLGLDSLQEIVTKYIQSSSEKTTIGIHLHENLSLSFAMAQNFIMRTKVSRNKMVDASLFGIGRVPGNLPVELVADFINKNVNSRYEIIHLLEAIYQEIMPLKSIHGWGYSPEYFISAIKNVHRTYSEELIEKYKLSLVKVAEIIEIIAADEMGAVFDSEYLSRLVQRNSKN
jgi:isopropylmalate/homocitrate/citramalate synthase